MPRQCHDARDGGIGFLQHSVVIRIDGDVGMYIAVPGVHVQRDEHTATQQVGVNLGNACRHWRKGQSRKNFREGFPQLALP